MDKLKKDQKNRLAIAEKVITRDALAAGVPMDDLISVADYVERGAVWRKPAKKKRRRKLKVQGSEHRAYWAEQGTPLPDTDPPGEPWKPLEYFTEDGLKEDPSFSVADAFRKPPAATVPGPPTLAKATLEKFAEKVRDGALAAEPAPVNLADGIDLRGTSPSWRTKARTFREEWHKGISVDELDRGNATGCQECAAELERRGLTDLDKVDPEETKLLEPSPVPGLSPPAWEAALKTAEKAGWSREEAEKHLNKCSPCRELAEKNANGELFTVEEAATITDTPLQKEPDATSSQPVGEEPGDRGVLLAWTEEVKRRNAEQEAAMEAQELERRAERRAE